VEKEVAACVVCFEDWSDLDQQTKQLYTCPCLVRICNECFLGWAKSQIESQLQREKVEWKCPRPADSRSEPQPQERQVRQACQVFPLDALVEMIQNFRDKNGAKMDPDFEQSIVECQNVLCDAALKHYLIRSEDIRACPDSKCTSYGIILIDPLTGFIECTKPLRCIACGVTWRDPLQRDTAATSVAHCLKQVSDWITRLRNNLIKIKAKPCPNCGVLTQKNGGCSLMGCAACKYKYCWDCLGSYERYRHDPQLAGEC